jgi:hypothetical protein
MEEGTTLWVLPEQIIFPEINIDKVSKINGMDITFVTTANTDVECHSLLTELGLPFKKKTKYRMAKESMKARQRKRQHMVKQYAAKRAALKEEGDYEGLQKLTKRCFTYPIKKPLFSNRKTKRVYERFWS